MSHKKFGPDRFSRFDVYWIQTDRQTDKPNLYIDWNLLLPEIMNIGTILTKEIMNIGHQLFGVKNEY